MKRFKEILITALVLGINAIVYAQGPGMMGGGMMGGYGMGPGMMGGYYQSEECQKFLDETAGLRKGLNDKRFEYSESYRNPKTTPETIVKLEREI